MLTKKKGGGWRKLFGEGERKGEGEGGQKISKKKISSLPFFILEVLLLLE